MAVGRGRAVHREHAALRHQVVHDREDGLLHLARVLGAEDDNLAVLDAEVDARLGGHARGEPVGGEPARVVDDVIGRPEGGKLLPGGADEHVVHEQRVVGPLADDPDANSMVGVPAGEAVDAIEPVAGVEIILGPLPVDLEAPGLQRDIDWPPPDVALRGRPADDPLVLGRPAGLLAGIRDQRAAVGDPGARVVADRLLVQRRGRRVTADIGDGDPVRLERKPGHGGHPLRPFGHSMVAGGLLRWPDRPSSHRPDCWLILGTS